MRLKRLVPGGKVGKRRAAQRVWEARTGEYDSGVFGARQGVAELDSARRDGAPAATFRQAHARIDEALARAAAAAADIHTALFDAAGGVHHAEIDPDVVLWKRRLNTALTLRSQHLMAQVDDEAVLPITGAAVGNRAAYGPQQAGLDFDLDPVVGGEAQPGGVLDLDGTRKRTPAESVT